MNTAPLTPFDKINGIINGVHAAGLNWRERGKKYSDHKALVEAKKNIEIIIFKLLTDLRDSLIKGDGKYIDVRYISRDELAQTKMNIKKYITEDVARRMVTEIIKDKMMKVDESVDLESGNIVMKFLLVVKKPIYKK